MIWNCKQMPIQLTFNGLPNKILKKVIQFPFEFE